MAYSDFTLERAIRDLGLSLEPARLFVSLEPAVPPSWLLDMLARGQAMPLVSEKARSERIVVPVLLAVRELAGGTLTIFSGQALNVEPEKGLVGECDFILARTAPLP